MGYYRTETYSTTGTKDSWNADPSITPFNLHVAVTLTTGPASYKLQYSLDPFGSVADADAAWFDSGDIPAATATSATTLFGSPVSRIRLVIATLTAGSLKMQAHQGLSTN